MGVSPVSTPPLAPCRLAAGEHEKITVVNSDGNPGSAAICCSPFLTPRCIVNVNNTNNTKEARGTVSRGVRGAKHRLPKQAEKKATSPVCPKCGGVIPCDESPGAYPGAISRIDLSTEICSQCGDEESRALFRTQDAYLASKGLNIWIRLPRPGEHERNTGLTRSVLTRLCIEGKVKSISLKDPGKARGCRLVNLPSLIHYLASLEAAQHSSTNASKE